MPKKKKTSSEHPDTERGSPRAMQRKGRRIPPNEHVIGRAEVARRLGYSASYIRRKFQTTGLLEPVLVDADGIEWFEVRRVDFIAAVLRMAWERKCPACAGKKPSERPSAPSLSRSPGRSTGDPLNRSRSDDRLGHDKPPRSAERPMYDPPVRTRPDPLLDPQPLKPQDGAPPRSLRLPTKTEFRPEWWRMPGDKPYVAAETASGEGVSPPPSPEGSGEMHDGDAK